MKKILKTIYQYTVCVLLFILIGESPEAAQWYEEKFLNK